jgi:tetratricopeptide (TPR) repeat protein
MGHRFLILISACMILTCGAVAPAFSGTGEASLKECQSADPNVRLRGCTSVIGGRGFGSKLDLANAFDGRCLANHSLSRFADAITDCNAAIRLKPNHSFAFCNLGTAYIGLKDYQNALIALNKSIELNPKFTWAYTKRGQVFAALAKTSLASVDFRKALELDPNNGEAQSALASISAAGQEQVVVAAATPSPTPAPPIVSVVAPTRDDGPKLKPTFERRIALVIGNSAYVNFTRIPNPRNDAEDLSKSLQSLGFDVVTGVDLRRSDMEEMLIRFARKARQADVALVFYAGHGIQYQGINYLAPIDAQLTDEADLRKMFNLQDVLSDLQAASRIRILIVDACRDNNAIQQLANSLPKSRSAESRGLARVEVDGTLVAFATQANKTAADGGGRNSPFTASILKRITEPSVELRTLMTRVRSDVVKATNGAQRPEVWDSLVGEFSFANAN